MLLFEKIIYDICKEKNINIKKHSYDWIYELEKNGKSRFVTHNQFGLNTVTSCKIADDKYATYEILHSKNIPIIEHNMIFNPISRDKYYKEEFIKKAKDILVRDGKVVLKGNNSYAGKEVFLVTEEDELYDIINQLFNSETDSISACPYIDIEYEYRVIYFYDQILLVYKKRKPYVVGNGIDTVGKLIEKRQNEEQLIIDIIKDLDLNYVPEVGEEVVVSWKHNLSGGAHALKVDKNTDDLATIIKLATEASRTIGINFASVDIVRDTKGNYMVMEINAAVCLTKFSTQYENGYQIAKDIYGKAIDKLFI